MKNLIFSTVLLFLLSFTVNAQDHVVPRKTNDAPPSEYPLGIYLMDSESSNPFLHPVDGGVIFGFKPIQSNYRHTQFLARSTYFKIRTKNSNNDSWETWRNILMENQDGNVGIGTTNPQSKLHISGTGISGGLILDNGSSPKIYTGIGNAELNRYLKILNSPGFTSPSGLMTGGLLVADSYTYAAPGKNDLIVKGNVGIGTATPDSKLTVKGKIHAEEVKVDLSVPGPDYVFNADYDLITLKALQNYIATNGHLPNIPSAKEMEKEGIELSVMNMKLLEKIEELTLYILQQEEQLKAQQQANKDLEARLEKLEKLINPK